jgi:outer membrane protein TolC
VLIGKAPAESASTRAIAAGVPTVEPGIPSTLLERRPDIAAAERLMASANAQIGVAQAAYYPNISLASTVTLVASSLSSLAALSNAVWSVGPAFTGTLFDGGALKAQVEGAGPSTIPRSRPTARPSWSPSSRSRMRWSSSAC